jgi:hypothetical protein
MRKGPDPLIQIQIHLELPKLPNSRSLVAGSAKDSEIVFGIAASFGSGVKMIHLKSIFRMAIAAFMLALLPDFTFDLS